MLTRSQVNALGVLLVPLIPVVLLYLLFKDQNFFNLSGTSKYVFSAGGPIAAYTAITWFAMREARKLWSNEANEAYVGQWDFAAKSPTGKSGNGTCTISEAGGDLKVNGTFKESNVPQTIWQAEFAIASGNRLVYLSELPTNTGGSFLNVVTLVVSKSDRRKITEMTGSWVGWKDTVKRGDVIFIRKT
jgi:hypothetical protein